MSKHSKTNSTFLGIALLKSFTKKELKRFFLFISSPYFNTDDKLVVLFNALCEHSLKADAFTEALQCLVFEIVFDIKLNQQQLEIRQKNMLTSKLSKLTKLCQKFLVTEGQDAHEIQYNEVLYKKLLDKKQYKMLYNILNKNRKNIKYKQKKSIEDFEHLYKTELYYLEYLFFTGKVLKKSENNLTKLIYHLDVQYILNVLDLNSTVFTSKINQNKNYLTTSNSIINNMCQLPQYKEEPNIIVHKAYYDFSKNFNEFDYNKLINALERHENSIPLSELQAMYIGLLNFTALQRRKGIQGSLQNQYNLFQIMDQKNLILADLFIDSVKIKNLVGISLKVGNIKKAKYYLKKYIPFVKKTYRKSVYNFCLSGIAFYEKDYDKALDHITNVESINVTYDVNCRFVMMKIYYEIDTTYNERTIRMFRSAEQFFKENKSLSTIDKKSYRNFVQILVNLYRIKHKEGKMNLQKLKAKLEALELNADKNWLLEKMDELKG